MTSDFISWNYDTKIATRYTRVGECNGCGDCCRRTINIEIGGGDKYKYGAPNPNGEGLWSEVENGSDKREFIKFKYLAPDHIKEFPFVDSSHECSGLIDNKCSYHGEEKPWVCKVWPTQPADIEQFPNCSYSFEEADNWEFEDEKD